MKRTIMENGQKVSSPGAHNYPPTVTIERRPKEEAYIQQSTEAEEEEEVSMIVL